MFAGVCALCGAIYLLFFCSNLGMETFKETIMFLMQSDTSHAKVDFDIIDYFRSFTYGASWIALVAAFSYIAAVIRKKKESFITYFGVGILLTEIVAIVLVGVVDIDWNCQYFVILLLLIGMGIKNHKAITQNVKALYYTGLIISVLSAISVMFLTNLDFLSVLGYLILGAMVSFIAINIGEKSRKESSCRICSFIILITVTFLCHRGIIVCGYANEDGINLVCDLENIVRVGPTKGIVASLQKCNEVRGTLTDWETYVKDEEVLVVVPWMLDSAIYVDLDAKISTYSTINTPTYDESLLEYWTKYPDKTPGIIAVEAWKGEISVRKNTWIMKWVEETYSTYDNGVFWRFYKKE